MTAGGPKVEPTTQPNYEDPDMKISTDRILTSHTGSLPRPADLDQMLFDREQGKDTPNLGKRVREVVAELVDQQIDAGVDVLNDGEAGKIGYSTYVKERLTGFGGESLPIASKEMLEYPGTIKGIVDSPAFQNMQLPACNAPVTLHDPDAVRRDIDNLKAAVAGKDVADVFLSAASPGVIATFLPNQYYKTQEEYLYALADAMKPEYEAISNAGIVLQVDCPDLAMTRVMGSNADLSDNQFRDQIRSHVEVLNYAVRDIPAENMRMHLCWGNGPFPHIYDPEMKNIIDVVLSAKPAGISFEAANPRHEHEWNVWESVQLPDGKVLIPGVLDSCTNYVEHPELVAQRLVRFAKLVGRENVIAGTDCGFGTFAGLYTVDPSVTWLKFKAMADGARLASEELW
jgi:5-methyltetrahydropteroyltriglutamate--homocysteine methyltransferase